MVTDDKLIQQLRELGNHEIDPAWQRRVLDSIDAGAQPRPYLCDGDDPDQDFESADTLDTIFIGELPFIIGARVTYVLATDAMRAEISWSDGAITSGSPDDPDMVTLLDRARREGVPVINAVLRQEPV